MASFLDNLGSNRNLIRSMILDFALRGVGSNTFQPTLPGSTSSSPRKPSPMTSDHSCPSSPKPSSPSPSPAAPKQFPSSKWLSSSSATQLATRSASPTTSRAFASASRSISSATPSRFRSASRSRHFWPSALANLKSPTQYQAARPAERLT